MISQDIRSKITASIQAWMYIIRTHRIDYEVLPVFLTLLRHKDPVVNLYIDNKDRKSGSEIYRIMYLKVAGDNETLAKAYSVFESSFDDQNKGLSIFGNLLYNFEQAGLKNLTDQEFGFYFETALEFAEKADPQVFYYGLPKELIKLLTCTYSPPSRFTVYNPFAGHAVLANQLSSNAYYFGEEYNTRAWAIGILNLFAHGKLEKSYFYHEDSHHSRGLSNYDFIVSCPPLNKKVSGGIYPFYPTYESALIGKTIDDFSGDQKAAFLIAPGFLTSEQTLLKQLRKELLDRKLLEYVILLPSKLLTNTSIPLVAIFLNASSGKDYVSFIDASTFEIPVSKKEKKLDIDKLLDVISTEFSDAKKRVYPSEIARNGYNMSVKRYMYSIADLTSEAPLVTLSEVAEERDRKLFKGSANAPFIRIKDLKTNILDGVLEPDNVESVHIPPQAYKVQYASLLLALRFRNLKPTILSFSDKNKFAFVSTDILTLKVDDKIDVRYLVIELNSDFVQKQVEGYLYGVTIQSIKRKDVLNLKIRLPDLDTQRKIVNKTFEKLYLKKDDELRQLKNQFDIKDEAFQAVASLKHSLGRPMLNINSGILNLEALIKNCGDENLKQQMLRITSALRQHLKVTNTILEHNENELKLERFSLQEMDLFSFMYDYVHSPADYSFVTTMNASLEIIQNLNGKIFITSNTELLQILFNNIWENAQLHAFKGIKNQGNVLAVNMEIASEKSPPTVIISIANNGEPFPENFAQDKFIKRSSKAGPTGNSGLGGYDINRIVGYLGGSFTLRLNEDQEFPTIYEIELPLLNTEENDSEEV